MNQFLSTRQDIENNMTPGVPSAITLAPRPRIQSEKVGRKQKEARLSADTYDGGLAVDIIQVSLSNRGRRVQKCLKNMFKKLRRSVWSASQYLHVSTRFENRSKTPS